MTEIAVKSEQTEQEPFEPVLWIDYDNGSGGSADGLPHIDSIGVDTDLKHKNWPTPAGARRIGKNTDGREVTPAISSYGYATYIEFCELDTETDFYLDSRVFVPGTNFTDVLIEATACALDDEKPDVALRLTEKVLEYAGNANFADETMKDYFEFAMATKDDGVIASYVRFMNENITKGPTEAKEFMKKMAHTIQGMEVRGFEAQDGMNGIVKQILLEEIGQAWIRKAMPVAEIDWLP